MDSSLKQRLRTPVNVGFVLTSALVPAWVIGQVVRDDSWVSGMCFYIPSLFLATVLAGFGLCFALRRQWRKSLAAVALGIAPALFVGLVENRFGGSSGNAPREALRLVHWNIGGRLRARGVRRALLGDHADVYVLSEIGDAASVDAFRDALGEGYQASVFGNLAVIAKGRLEARGWLLHRGGAKVQSVVWEFAGQCLTLFVVDLPANLLVRRDPLLREIVALVVRNRPDLVVGDFNAPRRSRALSRLPVGYRHAYDIAGRGLGYTWPVPFPLYAIDHCLCAPGVVPLEYELRSSIDSDHRRQILRFVRNDRRAQPSMHGDRAHGMKDPAVVPSGYARR